MSPLSRIFPTVYCDSEAQPSLTATAIKTVRTAVAVPESELKRWRRTFESNAKVINGEKLVQHMITCFKEVLSLNVQFFPDI